MAPATDYRGSFLGRMSIRRNQIVSMDVNHEQDLQELEKHISERFSQLISDGDGASDNTLLSISWLRKLLDVFLSCEKEFRGVLVSGRDPTNISKPPLDRLVTEMLERGVKALDICTAVINGVDSVRQCQRLAEIVVTALEQRPLSDGNIRRAKRALCSLAAALNVEEKHMDSSGSGGANKGGGGGSSAGHFRQCNLSVGKNWSAAKQIQAMTANLIAPRGGDALRVYMMNVITVFVMWVLVAAVPCQERNGLCTHLPIPKQLSWAQAAVALQDYIGEEIKKKEKKGFAVGLMEEMVRMESLRQGLMELVENYHFPMEEEKEEEVAEKVAEMAEVCRMMEEGLMPLQQQVREVFHRIVRSRTEILEVLDQAGKVSSPSM